MKKRLFVVSGVFVMVAVFVLMHFSTALAEKPKPIVLSFNHLFPAGSWFNTEVVVSWKKMVEEKTQGRVKINIYPSAALAKPGTMYDAVKAGAIDIALDPGPYYIGRFPLSEATQLPFLGATSCWAASRAWMDLYREFPELRKEYADTHFLWLFSQGPGQIFSKEPVRTMEDMKGRIFRAPGGIGEIVKALGGSPVSMSAGESYLALSKGTVDATIFDAEAIKVFKLSDVTKYVTVADLYVMCFWVVMNKDKYNSLPKDIQKVIDEASGIAGADLVGKAWNTADKAGFEWGLKKGMKAIYLTPEETARWKKQCAPVTEEWIKKTEAKGLPGGKFVEAAKRHIEKYNKEFGHWQD